MSWKSCKNTSKNVGKVAKTPQKSLEKLQKIPKNPLEKLHTSVIIHVNERIGGVFLLQRELYKDIFNWVINGKTALTVTGARQTGKTFLIRECIKKSGKSFVEINFIENPEYISIFSNEGSVKDILFRLSAVFGKSLVPGETIIFIDEVQEYKDMITKIKFLVDDNTYKYILSGSLLGVELSNLRSAPVGYMKILEMYPLNIKEFYKALGMTDAVLDTVKECFDSKTPVDDFVHSKLMDAFYLYLMVGGMPQAVATYLSTNDMNKVLEIHQDINRLYKLDFTKYEKQQNLRLKEIYDSIPGELNDQNKRFFLNKLGERTSIRRVENSFVWLKDAGVALAIYNVTEPMAPLRVSEKRNLFKLFLLDVGMLTSMYPNSIKLSIFNRDKNLNNGALFENAVAQELVSKGYDVYYYNGKKQGEIDLLIERNGAVLPIEVKSGKDYKIHSALDNVLSNESYGIPEAFIFNNENVEIVGKKNYMPIYMAMFLEEDNQSTGIIKVGLGDL